MNKDIKDTLIKLSALINMTDTLLSHYETRLKEDNEISVKELLFTLGVISDAYSEVVNECHEVLKGLDKDE